MSSSLQQKAAYLKSQGNSYFKAKDYLKAIESYTAAIRIDPAML
jgi:tetratricopeptide (TPR) repeat protein